MTDAWTLSLFDEDPKVYGPKPPRPVVVAQGDKARLNPDNRRDTMAPYVEGMAGGAPPLDWWVIDD